MNPYNNFNNNTRNVNASSNNEMTSAQLAVLGGFFSTIGDVLSTYAAVLALEELQQTQNNNNNDKINELEKQIKYLTKEMHRQKNMKK